MNQAFYAHMNNKRKMKKKKLSPQTLYCKETNSSFLKLTQIDAIPIEISTCFCIDIDKLILNFIWKGNDKPNSQIIMENKNAIGIIILKPEFWTQCPNSWNSTCHV
jgi:hypothetical protein